MIPNESKTQKTNEIRVELHALDLAHKDVSENLKRMRASLESQGAQRASDPRPTLALFPELTLTGFVTDQPSAVACERTSKSVQDAVKLAQEFGVALGFGFVEYVAGQIKPQNTYWVVNERGELLGDYQKIHLFTGGAPSEAMTYRPGQQACVLEWQGWKFGLGICFDLRFPMLWETYAHAEVDGLILPACWLGGESKSAQLKALASGLAVSSRAYFLATNRSGSDPVAHYEGDLLAIAPSAQVLLETRCEVSSVASVVLSAESLARSRKIKVDRAHERTLYEIKSR
jgi:predicted amidohydrolase